MTSRVSAKGENRDHKATGHVNLAILSVLWVRRFAHPDRQQIHAPLAFASARSHRAVALYAFIRVQGQEMPRIGGSGLRFWSSAVQCPAPAPVRVCREGDSSGLTSVLNSTVPIMTVILAHFLTDEVLTADRAVGVGVGFAGVLIVLLPTLDSGMASGASRPIAVLLASLFMALAAIYARKYLKGVDPAKTATGMMATAAIAGIPLTLLFENPAAIRPTHESLIALAVLGVLCSAIAFLLYYWLIANRGATFASLVMFTQPPLAIIFAAIFVGTTVQWTTIAGMIVILLCIATMNGFFDRFRRKPHETKPKAQG